MRDKDAKETLTQRERGLKEELCTAGAASLGDDAQSPPGHRPNKVVVNTN